MYSIAFDLGRVLFDFDYSIALDKIQDKINVSKEKIITDMFYANFATDFEKGLISSNDFYLKFRKAYGADITYKEFISIWCDIFSPKPEIIALARKLRADYPLYLISNINEAHFKYLERGYPKVFALFKSLILSYEIKSIKPEKKIYEALRVAARQHYKNIIYIDDREDLILEAKKLNLNCIQFKNLKNLANSLNYFNIRTPS